MAFGGIGTVGQLVGIEVGVVLTNAGGQFALNPPGRYVQSGANGQWSGGLLGLPNDDDRFWRKGVVTAPNTNIPMAERAALQSLMIMAIGNETADLLSICEDAPDLVNGNTTDVGILSTAIPDGGVPPEGGGRHFLPANFGVGRNNWVPDDIASIRVSWWINTLLCADAAIDLDVSPYVVEIRPVQFGAAVDAYGRPVGNIEIVARNRGGVALPSGSAILITALHSIQR